MKTTESIRFLVQGSSAEPYEVTFVKRGENLSASCTCPDGQNRLSCKHRLNILEGLICILTILSLILVGCGTDVKPTYFLDMLRDDNDIDRLSECLLELPQVNENTLTIKTDISCLTDLSNRDTSDPYIDASFSEILDDPEFYLNKIVSFEATVKEVSLIGYHSVELYTNRKDISFEITARDSDADLHILDEEGEEQDLENGAKYKFTCWIYQIQIDETGHWDIDADLILSTDGETIINLPELVETDD